jgi:hypothetical protein
MSIEAEPLNWFPISRLSFTLDDVTGSKPTGLTLPL